MRCYTLQQNWLNPGIGGIFFKNAEPPYLILGRRPRYRGEHVIAPSENSVQLPMTEALAREVRTDGLMMSASLKLNGDHLILDTAGNDEQGALLFCEFTTRVNEEAHVYCPQPMAIMRSFVDFKLNKSYCRWLVLVALQDGDVLQALKEEKRLVRQSWIHIIPKYRSTTVTRHISCIKVFGDEVKSWPNPPFDGSAYGRNWAD
ncbi:MAG TPA: hypothetical protein V6C81_11540 [Planktothrix sp.]